MKGYCGYHIDNETVKACASGGIATAMYEKVLSQNGVGYGVSYTDDYKGVKYIRITDIKDIIKLRGSKYIKADLSEKILNEICSDIRNNKIVLFVGLPCEVDILNQYLLKNELSTDNLITVDLVCQGPTYPEVFYEYIKDLEKKYKSRVTNVVIPYKRPSKLPARVKIEFENGKCYVEKMAYTEFNIAFVNMKYKECYNCKYRNGKSKADITIGDCWGIEIKNPFFNLYGISLCVTYTNKGDDFLNSINTLKLSDYGLDRIFRRFPSNEIINKRINDGRTFEENYRKYGLKKAVFKKVGIKGVVLRRTDTLRIQLRRLKIKLKKILRNKGK